ncbi:MAG: ABC transporter ATP-binding protein [Egibacteraceae bacterium]
MQASGLRAADASSANPTSPAPAGGAATIEVDGLTKSFGYVHAVADLSFRVRGGAVTGFLGPNGAGKTTTLRMVLGLAKPTAGHALIEGVPYRRLEHPGRVVGASLERSGAHPGRSARNHLRQLAAAEGLPFTRVDEVLATVDLSGAEDRRVGGYSLGMRQRLALGVALLGDPGILVLDEPANGLDPQGIRWLRDFLRTMAGEGRTVLVSSHVLAEVAQTVDDVVVISRGRLVHQGPMRDLIHRANGGAELRVRSPRAEALAAELAPAGASVTPAGEGTLLVTGVSAATIGDVASAAAIPLHELSERSASLEDVFLQLTGSRIDAEATA